MNRSTASGYTESITCCKLELAMPLIDRLVLILLTSLLLPVLGLSAEEPVKEPAKEDDGFRWTVVPGPRLDFALGEAF